MNGYSYVTLSRLRGPGMKRCFAITIKRNLRFSELPSTSPIRWVV